ncbi:O-antigen ligase family protein [Marinobacter salsuginis]|uniref:O-antigen ligase family protein n=1 Tax=Marinobacter salsuginis TaxID=418719 RepID=UPI001299188B|nr:O-antigen ligase family protein [Marinobacter salsuginis]
MPLLLGLTLLLTGVGLFAVLLPGTSWAYSDQRFVLCIAIWLTTCFLLFQKLAFRRTDSSGDWLFWILPFLTVFVLGELCISTYRVEPLMFGFFFLSVFLFGAYLSRIEELDIAIGRASILIGILALLYGCVSLMNYGLALSDKNPDIDEVITWGVPNIRYWSHLATWLIPLLAVAQRCESLSALPLVRFLIFSSGAIWWWMLITTSARGSILGLIVGAALVGLLLRKAALVWLRAAVGQMAGGIILWLVLTLIVPWMLFGFAEPRSVDLNSSGRLPLWREAWEMSLVNFPFGMGPQSWLTHSIITDTLDNSSHLGHPHNMYLLWAAEYGWISIAAFGFAVAGVGKSVLARTIEHRSSRKAETIMAGLMASTVGAFVHAGVSAVFMAPASMLVGFLVLSMFLGKFQSPVVATRERTSRPLVFFAKNVSVGVVLVVCLVSGFFWMGEVVRYYKDNIEDRQTYKGQGSIYSPRFWSHGDFPRQ